MEFIYLWVIYWTVISLFFKVSLVLAVILAYIDFRKKRFYFLQRLLITDSIIITVFLFVLVILGFFYSYPTAGQLSRNYFQHKAAFNQLEKRIETDQKKGLERVADDYTKPEDISKIKLTDQDIQNYRDDFKNLNTPSGFYAYPDAVDFAVYGIGMVASSEIYRGYLYTLKSPTDYFGDECVAQVKDIDSNTECKENPHSYAVFQRIDKNWYIYEQFVE